MSGFQNSLEMNTSAYPMFYTDTNIPTVSPLWNEGASHNVGLPSSFVGIGYQQQGHFVYPFNVLQNSSGFGSHFNLNQIPQTNLPLQSSPINSGNVVFQSTPNLTSPLSLTSPLANNPHFIHYNNQSPIEQIMPQTLSQITPMGYSIPQPQPPLTRPPSNQQIEMWLQHHLQQQNLQQQQNKIQQQHVQNLNQHLNEAPVNNDTYNHHRDGSNQNIAETPNQSVANLPNQIVTNPSNQTVPNPSNQSVAETQTEYSSHSTSTNDTPESFYIAAMQTASPSIYPRSLNNPRPNTLPGNFPTSLNPSLQIKRQANLIDSRQKFHKSDYSPSSFQNDFIHKELKEAKIDGQSDQDIPEKSPSLIPSAATMSTVSSQLAQGNTQPSDYSATKPVYDKPKNKDHCLRCGKKVYPMERTGPIKEVVYHKTCFTCVTCGTTLNLKNFHHNPNDTDDLSVYCMSHKPKERTRSCDANSVHIKTALTAPKLDKINDQIRSDRQPSEVLLRSGYTQPAASALSTTREQLYYGMHAAENAKSDQTHQSQHNQTQQHHHQEQRHHQLEMQEQRHQQLEMQEQRHQQLEMQQQRHQQLEMQQQRHQQLEMQQQAKQLQKLKQHEQHKEIQHLQEEEEQASNQLSESSRNLQDHLQENDQQQYNQLLLQNIQLQQKILENEETLINGVGKITIPENEERNNPQNYVKVAAQTSLVQDDDVFTSHDQNQPNSDKEDKGTNRKSASSSFSSSLSSSVIHQEIHSGESLDEYLANHFKLNNHDVLNQHKQYPFRNNGVQTTSERELVSNQSSRSISPMQIQTGSRSTDDNESRRSSFSSNLSSRDSVDLGASAVSYSRQHQLSSNMERTDRPSSIKNTVILDASNGKNLSTRMIDTSKTDYNIEVPHHGTDLDRYLPKNERMRMDRPSQYS